jgi:biopolymer transport protein ExbD
MIVEMDYTGATFVDGQPKSQAEIDALLADWLATAIDKTLVVRADALCESRLVLDLMRRAQTAGFEHFFIAGEARKPE